MKKLRIMILLIILSFSFFLIVYFKKRNYELSYKVKKYTVTERYIKDTKWITEKHADEGYELTTEEKTTTNTTYISLGKWVDSKEALGEYTYNIETRTLYKYKTRTTSSSEEYTWATEKPDGYEPTGRSRTKFIPNRRNVQK